jgi:hypothetical protein
MKYIELNIYKLWKTQNKKISKEKYNQMIWFYKIWEINWNLLQINNKNIHCEYIFIIYKAITYNIYIVFY